MPLSSASHVKIVTCMMHACKQHTIPYSCTPLSITNKLSYTILDVSELNDDVIYPDMNNDVCFIRNNKFIKQNSTVWYSIAAGWFGSRDYWPSEQTKCSLLHCLSMSAYVSRHQVQSIDYTTQTLSNIVVKLQFLSTLLERATYFQISVC